MKNLWAQSGGKALALAIVMLAATALIALWNVSNRDGITCGSWLAPNDTEAAYVDAQENSRVASLELGFALQGDYSGLAFKPAKNAQVANCGNARKGRTPLVVVFAVCAVAMFATGISPILP